MIWLTAFGAVAAFAILLRGVGVARRVRDVSSHGTSALGVLRDGTLDDLAKERAMRQHAVGMLRLFFDLTLRIAIAALIPLAALLLLDSVGVLQWEAVLEYTLHWELLLAACAVGAVAFWWPSRRR
ncbi:MAG: hypothetical protein KDC87_00570 [Planctomycetes bacterium]|nr:hypothetical protein [Planctomycetota bacterium]MCB9869231.1 hypothetical protein [Planctomycetota bacterium]MCB9889370.1 hypothetical protein [Planctomycetota bacterium]